jgi:DNA-binding response OmpR family regulator
MKKKILLVDDEELILHALSTDFAENGFDVVPVNSGKKGIKELKNNHFDLLITDLSMENMTGLEMLKKAKKIDSELIVIILTGYGSLESAIDALRLGADDYLLKPCNFEELLFRMGNCLEKQEMQKKIKLYENLLPICCMCKKIRDDKGGESGSEKWLEFDEYITVRTGINFTHGYCPDCYDNAVKDL